MNPTEFNKLAEYQQEVARLQKGLVKFNRKLAALPAKYGFKTMGEFIEALRRAADDKSVPVARKSKAGKTRKRTKITPEVKEKVKVLVKEEKTGEEIAKSVGISLPSVQNIKKELGLVKKRGK
jgi:hypothetical protein